MNWLSVMIIDWFSVISFDYLFIYWLIVTKSLAALLCNLIHTYLSDSIYV